MYPSSARDAAALKGIDPIIARLRPRDVVGIIDQAFRIYRGHFLTFLAIIAVVEVPLQGLMQIANVLLIGSTVSPLSSDYYRLQTSPSSINERFTNQLVYLGVISGLAILYQVFMSFAQAALTSSVADNYLDRPVSFTGAYKHVFRRAGPVIGLMLLELLIVVVAFLPTILVLAITVAALAGGSGSSGGATALVCLAFPLIFIGFGFLIYAFVRLQAALPALMVENLGPAQAVRRSWRLLDGYWWRTAGLLLIVYILNLIVSSGPAALISSITLLFVRLDPVLSEAITGAVTVLTTAIFIPVQLTATALLFRHPRAARGLRPGSSHLGGLPRSVPIWASALLSSEGPGNSRASRTRRMVTVCRPNRGSSQRQVIHCRAQRATASRYQCRTAAGTRRTEIVHPLRKATGAVATKQRTRAVRMASRYGTGEEPQG